LQRHRTGGTRKLIGWIEFDAIKSGQGNIPSACSW